VLAWALFERLRREKGAAPAAQTAAPSVAG